MGNKTVTSPNRRNTTERDTKGYRKRRERRRAVVEVRRMVKYELKHDDLVNPVAELSDSRVDARLVGLCAADTPRNNTAQRPMVSLLQHHWSSAVTLA